MASTSGAAGSSAAEERKMRGLWIPSAMDNAELQVMEDEGFIIVVTWWSALGHAVPGPLDGERVLFGTHADRGLSLPPSDFLIEVLHYYGVQLHNLPPNSLLELSSHAALCEGFLGIRSSLTLFRYYYGTRKNSISAGVPYTTDTLSLVLRRNRVYHRINASKSVKRWAGTFFYHKDIPAPGKAEGLPAFSDGAASHQNSWDAEVPELSDILILAKRRIEFLMKHEGLRGSDLIHCWLERRIQPLQHHGDRLMHQITSDKKYKMRVSSSRIPAKDYKTLMQFLIKERVERKIPKVSMKMYTTNRPLTSLEKLSESELAPLEGHASDNPEATEDDEVQ